jgi:cbb3-type cytochrome oxidase subunit 1
VDFSFDDGWRARIAAMMSKSTTCRRFRCLVALRGLILGGLFQGAFWAALYPWQDSIDVLYPFWVVRVLAGIAMFGGVCAFLWNIFKTWQRAIAVVPAPAAT